MNYYGSTEGYFKEKLLEIDSLCEVDFHPPEAPFAIRVRPSHPRYRTALIEAAFGAIPIGVLVSVVKEVDDWECCTQPYFYRSILDINLMPKAKLNWWGKVKGWIHRSKSRR